MYINLSEIASKFNEHSISSNYFKVSKLQFENKIREYYESGKSQFRLGDRAQEFSLPYLSQGQVDSPNLFGMNELILFAYYELTVGYKYKKVLDLGANIGLHTILLSMLGARVTAVEPDPLTFQELSNNVADELPNHKVNLINAAACTKDLKSVKFLRVMQNRTGSHLLGARELLPYGGFEEISVPGLSIKGLLNESYDLVKIDVEGSEADLLCSFDLDLFSETSYMVEIGSEVNAKKIWNHVNKCGFNAFSQKNGWKKVLDAIELPIHHSEGTLFITRENVMHWSIQ